jgi:hypothetical protein
MFVGHLCLQRGYEAMEHCARYIVVTKKVGKEAVVNKV